MHGWQDCVIVIALVWRWTGYNMVFYLAGLQNIDYSVYEASRIDGAITVSTVYEDHDSAVKAYHITDGYYVNVWNTAVV
ncbi:MAG: ABC transporter permease subunit [Roseburia inulinivorans]